MTRLDYLQSQYEDAYFALLMHEVAEQEGVRLEKLNEELQNDPAAAVPEEVDRKCLKTIDRYFAQKRHAAYWKTSKTILGRVAIVAAVIMLLFTTAFALSEDFRVSTLNLLITIEEKFTQLHMESTEDSTANDLQAEESTTSSYFDHLEIGWMPEGYTCIINNPNQMIGFENDQGDSFTISLADGHGKINIDTENADKVEELTINGLATMRVTKDGCINTVMIDTEHGVIIRAWTSAGIPLDVNQKLAENLKYVN